MERRRFTRFRARDDAFAAIRGSFNKVGKIYDISLNGLAFRYLTEQITKEKATHVDVFLSGNGFHMPGLPCSMIYHVKESTSGTLSIVPYRCGLKFVGMKKEQKNMLEFFIKNHTRGAL